MCDRLMEFEESAAPVLAASGLVIEELAGGLDAFDDDVPPAGTACVGCKRLGNRFGHWCPAKCYRGADTPLCMACARGEDCAVMLKRKQPRSTAWMDADEAKAERLDAPSSPVRDVTPVDAAKRVVVDAAKRVVADAPKELRRMGTVLAPLIVSETALGDR